MDESCHLVNPRSIAAACYLRSFGSSTKRQKVYLFAQQQQQGNSSSAGARRNFSNKKNRSIISKSQGKLHPKFWPDYRAREPAQKGKKRSGATSLQLLQNCQNCNGSVFISGFLNVNNTYRSTLFESNMKEPQKFPLWKFLWESDIFPFPGIPIPIGKKKQRKIRYVPLSN